MTTVSGIDVSFLGLPEEDEEEKTTVAGVDVSFLGIKPMTPAETTQQIVEAQAEGQFPQGARDNISGYYNQFRTAISGADRETRATRELPELGSQMGLDEFLGRDSFRNLADAVGGIKTASALLTTMNPVETVEILQKHAGPDFSVRSDEAGNIILFNSGKEAILNKPGMTAKDWMQLGGLAAAYSPAGRVATAPTIIRNAARVGSAAAATQAGLEGLQASEGGRFDPLDIAIAGTSAAGLQATFQGLAQSIPWLRARYQDLGIDDKIRRVFKTAAVRAGYKADDVTDDMINRSISAVDQPATPEEAMGLQGEREFGIRLTQGQRTGSQQQLSFEDSARSGALGHKPQRTMLEFERETQFPAVKQAVSDLDTRIGPPSNARPGAVLREGVREAERIGDAAYQESLEQVGKANLSVEGLKGLMRNTRRAVMGTEFDQSLPETSKMLALSRSFSRDLQNGKIKPLDLNRIEQMRRRINTAIGSADNTIDKRQVLLMKRAFDDYLDDAVEQALFSGDAGALEALKTSRKIFHDYARKFRAQPKTGRSGRVVDRDPPGQLIEKIIDANPTDEEIVNAVFGASRINKSTGAAMAKRYREILGAESEGWTAIRHEALRRIFQTSKVGTNDVVSGSKTLSALDDAMEKSGTLMREIFTKEELAKIRRLAVHIKRTQPDLVRSRENPSGTAQKSAKLLREMVDKVMLAFHMTGEPIIAASAQGARMAGGWRNASRAGAAIRPFDLPYRLRPGIVETGTAGVLQLRD